MILYFVEFIIGLTLAAALAAMMYADSTNAAAGTKAAFFALAPFVNGALWAFPFVAMISLVMLIMICVRSKYRSPVSFGIVVALTAVTFAVLIPLSFRIQGGKSGTQQARSASVAATGAQSATVSGTGAQSPFAARGTKENVVLTPGYFRGTESGTYYFTAINKSYIASGVKTVTDENKIFSPFRNEQLVLTEADKKRDVLISNAVQKPPLLTAIIGAVKAFSADGMRTFANGWLPYIGFASASLGILSLWGVSFFSSWPLLSMLFVLYGFTGVIALNYTVTSTQYFAPFTVFLRQYLGSMVDSPFFLQLTCNAFLFVVLSVAGFLVWNRRRRKYAGAEE